MNGRYYGFNCMTYKFLEIPDALKNITQEYLLNNQLYSFDKDQVKNFLDFFQMHRCFFLGNIDITVNKPKMPIFSFCPVHNCNFTCRYCFAKESNYYDHQIISADTVSSVFYYMLSRFKEYDDFRLEFVSGGEPLLNFHAIKHACLLAEKLRAENKNIRVFLVTNGSLLTDDILSFLEKHNVYLGISFEGTEDYQNYLRQMKSGNKSYDCVAPIIKKIKHNHQLTNLNNNLWIISVITSYCSSLEEIIEAHLKLGIQSAELRIARGNEESKLFLNHDNVDYFKSLYQKLFHYLSINLLNNRFKPLFLILNNYDTFGKLVKRLICGDHVLYRCGAGATKLAFAANGDIYPCDSFAGHTNYRLGNAKDVYHAEYFSREDIRNREPCSHCEFRFLCGGDCYYNSFVNRKDPQNCNTAYCLLMKELCDLAVKLVILLKNDQYKFTQIQRHLIMRDYINNY